MHRKKEQFTALLIILPLLFISLYVANYVAQYRTENRTRAQSGASVYSGVYTEDYSQLPAFESDSGKAVSLFMIFHSFNAGNFPTGLMDAIRNHGSIPVISWDSYTPENAEATSWKNISEGSMDSYIQQWAIDSKNWGHPYFLRFDWEMNGYWQPYSKQFESFVPMWKHVHDIFSQNGASNVTWVWCPNVDGYSTMPLEPLYPGNDYVDWVCMDGYNFGTSVSWGSWQSFSEIFAPTYNHLLKLAPNKPIMIAEFASSETGGSKGDWITDMLIKRLPNNFPNIKALIWFNINKETDWRIESSVGSKLSFAQGIASSYYAGNQFGDISNSPIPYLGSLSGQSAAVIPVTQKEVLIPTWTQSPSPSPTPEIVPISPLIQPTTISEKKQIDTKTIAAIMLWIAIALTTIALVKVLIKKRR
jgi:hypothetical protein